MIVSPYDRAPSELKLARPDKRKLRRADPPIVIKLKRQVSDMAGNVGTTQERIELIEDL